MSTVYINFLQSGPIILTDKIVMALRLSPCGHLLCPTCALALLKSKQTPTCTAQACKRSGHPSSLRPLREADRGRVTIRAFRVAPANMDNYVVERDDDRGLFELIIGLWNGMGDKDLDEV